MSKNSFIIGGLMVLIVIALFIVGYNYSKDKVFYYYDAYNKKCFFRNGNASIRPETFEKIYQKQSECEKDTIPK